MPLAQADVFAPVTLIIPVDEPSEAVAAVNQCPYGLGAAVFARPDRAARIAGQLQVGCVVVNDLIAPTADPRVSFAGWKQSGFGVTRGPEGLLHLTRTKTIVTQGSRWRPHLQDLVEPPRRLLQGLLAWTHGRTLARQWSGLRQLVRGGSNPASVRDQHPLAD
jgi:aldehyde dehydrogenase (NAD+)